MNIWQAILLGISLVITISIIIESDEDEHIKQERNERAVKLLFSESNNFEVFIMDLMESKKDDLKTAEDVEEFSCELHQSIEAAITDMLEDGFNEIDEESYESQY